jgi:GT2 family glycosyltransferase
MSATADSSFETPRTLGVVVIGRNEGARLRRCLSSIAGSCAKIVYVDSGSTDESVALARSMNVEVVDLDLSVPFTAARARNEGFARLTDHDDTIAYVQFVDGDCELAADWLSNAVAAIEPARDVAIVCGRLQERFPEQSVYNRICAIEWNGPVGDIAACGGIFMIRASEFKKVSGFDPTIIAAEDDDLCLRVRGNGGKVIRIDRPMAWHDAAMTRVSQWWRRAVRCGFAFAQISSLHGKGPFRHFVHETRSTWVWGFFIPVAIVVLAVLTRGWALLAFPVLYLFATYRIAGNERLRELSPGMRWAYATHCLASKFPQVVGQVKFWWRRAWNAPSVIIEHKDAGRKLST